MKDAARPPTAFRQSPWTSLDPRARVLIVVCATVIVASTQHLKAFAIYLPLIAVSIALFSRASWIYLVQRLTACSPFVLLAALLLLFQYDLDAAGRPAGIVPAALIAAKGYSAALLLAFLTESTPLPQILWAMRKLGCPESLNLILGMMYRYTALLEEEWGKLERARSSRTVRPLAHRQMFGIYGRQLGVLLVRSWERADRVHAAMLARGFEGNWPLWHSPRFQRKDALVLSAAVVALLFIRIAVQ
jgi:cobalt/nickel transport system permease protein